MPGLLFVVLKTSTMKGTQSLGHVIYPIRAGWRGCIRSEVPVEAEWGYKPITPILRDFTKTSGNSQARLSDDVRFSVVDRCRGLTCGTCSVRSCTVATSPTTGTGACAGHTWRSTWSQIWWVTAPAGAAHIDPYPVEERDGGRMLTKGAIKGGSLKTRLHGFHGSFMSDTPKSKLKSLLAGA